MERECHSPGLSTPVSCGSAIQQTTARAIPRSQVLLEPHTMAVTALHSSSLPLVSASPSSLPSFPTRPRRRPAPSAILRHARTDVSVPTLQPKPPKSDATKVCCDVEGRDRTTADQVSEYCTEAASDEAVDGCKRR